MQILCCFTKWLPSHTEFYGMELWMLKKAIEALAKEGKAELIPGSSPDDSDAGVKFFSWQQHLYNRVIMYYVNVYVCCMAVQVMSWSIYKLWHRKWPVNYCWADIECWWTRIPLKRLGNIKKGSESDWTKHKREYFTSQECIKKCLVKLYNVKLHQDMSIVTCNWPTKKPW